MDKCIKEYNAYKSRTTAYRIIVISESNKNDKSLSINSKNRTVSVYYSRESDNPSIRIYDSYKITSRYEMIGILKQIMKNPNYKKANYGRTLRSMLLEWVVHNEVYYLLDKLPGFLKTGEIKKAIERAKTVDLDRNSEGKSANQIIASAILN